VNNDVLLAGRMRSSDGHGIQNLQVHAGVHVLLKIWCWVSCNHQPALNLQRTVSFEDLLQGPQPLPEPHGHADQKEVWQALTTPIVGLLGS